MLSYSLLAPNDRGLSTQSSDSTAQIPNIVSSITQAKLALVVISPESWQLTTICDSLAELGYRCKFATTIEFAVHNIKALKLDLVLVEQQLYEPDWQRGTDFVGPLMEAIDTQASATPVLILANHPNRQKLLPNFGRALQNCLVSTNSSNAEIQAKIQRANDLQRYHQSVKRQNSQDKQLQIGNYRILSKLGAGGMGLVYRGEHVLNGQVRAIKILRRDRCDIKSKQRFQREAFILQNLNHKHLVKVYDVGMHQDSIYFAMDLVDGYSVKQYKGRWPSLRVGLYLQKLAGALEYIHGLGILHRDIKPSNIIVAKPSIIKLTDFGLAKRSFDSRVTATNTMVGTVGYIAPEVMVGLPQSAQSDLFALGLVALEMVNGKKTFSNMATYDIMRALTDGNFPKAQDDERVNPQLAEIIDGLTQAKPEKRIGSATELKSRLNKWLKLERQSQSKRNRSTRRKRISG